MIKCKRFEDIEIDTEEVSQEDLDIENRVRTNIFAWNGQFSPQFVEALIDKYADRSFVVLDPFLGSGTTLYECARKGIEAHGVELNPSAYYMAKTYEIVNLDEKQREVLISQVEELLNSIEQEENIVSTIVSAIGENKTTYDNVLSTLVVLLDIFKNEINWKCLSEKWEKLCKIIREIPYSDKQISARMGDARHIEMEDNSVDLMITSPPYINVFNYHQKYRRSVEALGYDVLKIAKKEFGSNRKNRGNRIYTVVGYCIDMALAMKEVSRVCKQDARMIYVVGRESSVLGYSFYNSELIYNIGMEIFGFMFSLRQQRVFKNRFGQMIYEDILHFENAKTIDISEEEIISKAREIAKRALEEKLKFTDNDNIELLKMAIDKVEQINKSEDKE